MSTRPTSRPALALALALAGLLTAGCNPVTALYFLFLLPPPKIEAKCEALEREKVVVIAYANRSAQFEYAGIDNDLARGISRELKDNVKGIKVVDVNEVREWRDEHANFELTDVGTHFDASRVVYIEVEKFTLYEEQSSTLFRGGAQVHLQVADMDKDGDIIFDEVVEVQFPGSRGIPTSEMSQDKFRRLFVAYLTRQIAHNFFPYRPDEDFVVN